MAIDNQRFSSSELGALESIRARGQATRSEIAHDIGLGLAMTARLVSHLQGVGLVRESGYAVSPRLGRQAALLEIAPDAAYVAAVDVGTEVVHLLITDLKGDPLYYRETSSDLFAGASHARIVAVIAELVVEMVQAAAIPPEQLAVVGVTVTGIVDSDRGVCLTRSFTPGWENLALTDALQALVSRPVLLEETSRAKSTAELRIGAAQDVAHFLYVDAGTAIGAGIVIDRRPFRGMHGLSGELGHIIVDPGGAQCRCGNLGCLQASSSARSLVAKARDLLRKDVFSALSACGDKLSLSDIAEAARLGDKMALSLLTQAGERLGEALSTALNLLGLDYVILGGRLIHCHPVVLEAAARIVDLRVLPMVSTKRVLVRSTLDSKASARGVAFQAVDWLFADPALRILSLRTAQNGNSPLRPHSVVVLG